MAARKTYEQASKQARDALAAAVLSDPGSHFPYKRDAVQEVLDANPNMGPGVPGEAEGADDDSRTVADYMTEAIADASEAYVTAQAAYLKDGTDESRSAYDAARDQLQAARLDHRARRGNEFTVGAAARRAG
jgi:hypothetical protein